MSDLLQRMISRLHEPVSPVEPILPSIFAPAPFPSELELNTLAPRPQTLHTETPSAEQHQRPVQPSTPPQQDVPARDEANNSNVPSSANPTSSAPELKPQEAPTSAEPHVTANIRDHSPAPAEQPMTVATESSAAIDPVAVAPETPASPVASRLAPDPKRAEPIFRTPFVPRHEAAARPTAKTEVTISIGHIEVRSAPVVQPAPARPKPTTLSLQSYLKRSREEIR